MIPIPLFRSFTAKMLAFYIVFTYINDNMGGGI